MNTEDIIYGERLPLEESPVDFPYVTKIAKAPFDSELMDGNYATFTLRDLVNRGKMRARNIEIHTVHGEILIYPILMTDPKDGQRIQITDEELLCIRRTCHPFAINWRNVLLLPDYIELRGQTMYVSQWAFVSTRAQKNMQYLANPVPDEIGNLRGNGTEMLYFGSATKNLFFDQFPDAKRQMYIPYMPEKIEGSYDTRYYHVHGRKDSNEFDECGAFIANRMHQLLRLAQGAQLKRSGEDAETYNANVTVYGWEKMGVHSPSGIHLLVSYIEDDNDSTVVVHTPRAAGALVHEDFKGHYCQQLSLRNDMHSWAVNDVGHFAHSRTPIPFYLSYAFAVKTDRNRRTILIVPTDIEPLE